MQPMTISQYFAVKAPTGTNITIGVPEWGNGGTIKSFEIISSLNNSYMTVIYFHNYKLVRLNFLM